jgi:hypothetical protein
MRTTVEAGRNGAMVTPSLYTSLLLIVAGAVLAPACSKPVAPVMQSHVVNLAMDGLTLGEERVETTIEGQRTTAEIQTTFSGPPAIRLLGRLVIDRGRPTFLRVSGESPSSLPSAVEVTATPDRTDTFLLRSPFPVHVLAALVRRSIVSARREFRLLPEGQANVHPCDSIEGPFADATCHAISGLASGPALVWVDARQALAAAVIQTPWGIVLATTPERDDSHPALLERFDVYSARE